MTPIEIEDIKKDCLVFDIETCASYPDGRPINITTNFDDYVKFAKCKWFGCYSYKYDKYVCDEVRGNEQRIKQFIAEHKILIGFNNEEFDTPICYNNNLMPEDKYFKQVDCLVVLGASSYQRHDGLPFKNRGALMGFKFKKNSLREIAAAMNLETQKSDIDYNIFFQDTYTDQERQDILFYLEADVKATKEMFDALWDYWLPFTDFLGDDNIKNLSWIRSSIASLTYKAACQTLGVEETYAERTKEQKEEMGGRVIEPKYEEARNVWYVDFTSLYPHIFTMFNLFAEKVPPEPGNVEESLKEVMDVGRKIATNKIWHGNEIFKVKGFYDISKRHPLCLDVEEKLKLRATLSKDDPKRYAVKIFLNSLYGAARSEIFEQVYTPNCGWDCCWLGQQINKLTEDMMETFGFETIAGDTDSIFVIAKEEKFDNESYVRECLKKVVDKIKENVPFPVDTYNIDIEDYLTYVKWPFEEQPAVYENDEQLEEFVDGIVADGSLMANKALAIIEYNKENTQVGHNIKNLKNRLLKRYMGKKKNYLYIVDGKVKLVGLPIIKDNATELGKKIYAEKIEPYIKLHNSASMPRHLMDDIIQYYLDQPDSLKLLAREFKVKPLTSYKNPNQIQAQISAGYFNGQDGVAYLIKNKKCGKAGKTAKYCTVDEAIENKLTIQDIDLEKLYNELKPFMEREKK